MHDGGSDEGKAAPGSDPAFQPGGAYANYYTSYAASVGDTSDSTAQIFGCGGTLSANPPLCAGLARRQPAAALTAILPGDIRIHRFIMKQLPTPFPV